MPVERSDKLAKRQALQRKFAAALAGRLQELEQGWLTAQQDLESLTVSDTFYRQVHSLAGAAGSFGFSLLGKQAQETEVVLQRFFQDEIDAAGLIAEVNLGLDRLKALSADGPEAESLQLSIPDAAVTGKGNESPRIYLLEDDADLAEEIGEQLSLFGYQVSAFGDDNDFQAAHGQQPADALIIDVMLPSGPLHGASLAKKLMESGLSKVPVIFISVREDWEARLAATRAGGDAYMTKPLDFVLLAEKLDQLLQRTPRAPYRVLIIDDDVLLAQHYASVLEQVGMETRQLNTPARLLDILAEVNPDLLLMDLYMPGCTGVEAARVIRQQSVYQGLPIIFLSTETESEKQNAALREGGDEFLRKPVADSRLVEAVNTRAERFRVIKQLMIHDGMTGLLNHINFKLALEREVALGQRRQGRFTVVMIDIDHFKSINDSYGHPVGDRVIKTVAWLLKQRMRNTDTIARYGGEEFAVILTDTMTTDARPLLDDFREQFSRIDFNLGDDHQNLTLSCGLAGFPSWPTADALVAAADEALYLAKQSGRNRVMVADDELVSTLGNDTETG